MHIQLKIQGYNYLFQHDAFEQRIPRSIQYYDTLAPLISNNYRIPQNEIVEEMHGRLNEPVYKKIKICNNVIYKLLKTKEREKQRRELIN